MPDPKAQSLFFFFAAALGKRASEFPGPPSNHGIDGLGALGAQGALPLAVEPLTQGRLGPRARNHPMGNLGPRFRGTEGVTQPGKKKIGGLGMGYRPGGFYQILMACLFFWPV